MEKKQKQFKVPGYLIAIILILVLCIVFIFVVQVPFANNYDAYQKEHRSAVAQISLWKDYLSREETVQAAINANKREYEAKSGALYVNGTVSPDDIRTMLNNFKYDIVNMAVSQGNADGSGKTNVAGGPLYSTTVSYRFIGTEENILQTLNFLELEAPNAYYVNSISIQNYVVEAEDGDQGGSGEGEGEGEDEEGSKTTSKKPIDEEIKVSTEAPTSAVLTGDSMFEISMSISLYYFQKPADLLVSESSAESTTSSASAA